MHQDANDVMFLCATLDLERKQSTGTDPVHERLVSTLSGRHTTA